MAGAADVADDVALGDALAGGDREGGLVGVTGGEPAAVVEAGEVAVAAAFGFGLRRTTVPEAAARIGVPSGTAMSIPSCIEPQRGPKPETTGAADRPDQALPLPPLDRPGRQRRRAGRRRAARRASPWIAATSPCSSSSWSSICSQRRDRARRGRRPAAPGGSAARRGRWPAPALRRRSRRGRLRSGPSPCAGGRPSPCTWLRSSRTRPTTASSMPCMRSRYSARAARSS